MKSKSQIEHWSREELSERRHPSHPVVREYALSTIGRIPQYVNIEQRTKLLDVGCGNGFFTYWFDKMCDATGIDYSKKMLELNPCKKTYCMSADHLKFKENSFDIVFEASLLHHAEYPTKVLAEMRRVSNKYVIIHEPNRNNPVMLMLCLKLKSERKALKFSIGYLRKFVESSKLKIIAAYSGRGIGPNIIANWSLPLVKVFDFKQPLGLYNTIIAEK